MQLWKVRPLIKGALTWIPGIYEWKLRHASTGGSDSARYCYSVWLRHLVMLHANGFRIPGKRVGELGPGDSIGFGLAALLSGASSYIGLDVAPFSQGSDHQAMLERLISLYADRTPIPDRSEFPRVFPLLESYDYPHWAIEQQTFSARVSGIRRALAQGVSANGSIRYDGDWLSASPVNRGSLDLIASQAVMEHVDNVEATYRATWDCLAPGGFSSHVIGLDSHRIAPSWNGHWAFSSQEWRVVRGTRPFLINREPLGVHLRLAAETGFEIVSVLRQYDDSGLDRNELADRFRTMDLEDVRTSGAMVILRKPLSS